MYTRLLAVLVLILLFTFSATSNAQQPIRIAFISNLEEGSTAYEPWLSLMSTATGTPMAWVSVKNTGQAMDALCAGEADVARLNTFNYLFTAQQGCASIILIGVGDFNAFTRSQIIVRVDSGITSLADLKGKIFCRPSDSSISGWRLPFVMLRAGGVNPETDLAELRTLTGSAQVVRAVYDGTCTAGAIVVDARRGLQATAPDVMDIVSVLQVSPSIPRDIIAIHPSVPEDTRNRIINAFFDTLVDPTNAQLYLDLFGWRGVLAADERLLDELRQQITQGGLVPQDFIR
jgi:phosphonate transport system substrate-binding protein